MRIHLTTTLLTGAGRCQQEPCVDQEHALWHWRCRTTDRHRGGTTGTRTVQQQPVAASHSELGSY